MTREEYGKMIADNAWQVFERYCAMFKSPSDAEIRQSGLAHLEKLAREALEATP